MKELAKYFLEYRVKSGLSQKELAMKAGIMQCQVSNYENGKQTVTFETLVKMAKAIGDRRLMKLIQNALVGQFV
jgi:transcriptional regulator with XRE-family HTH domain